MAQRGQQLVEVGVPPGGAGLQRDEAVALVHGGAHVQAQGALAQRAHDEGVDAGDRPEREAPQVGLVDQQQPHEVDPLGGQPAEQLDPAQRLEVVRDEHDRRRPLGDRGERLLEAAGHGDGEARAELLGDRLLPDVARVGHDDDGDGHVGDGGRGSCHGRALQGRAWSGELATAGGPFQPRRAAMRGARPRPVCYRLLA